jgi:hypothetical protein
VAIDAPPKSVKFEGQRYKQDGTSASEREAYFSSTVMGL